MGQRSSPLRIIIFVTIGFCLLASAIGGSGKRRSPSLTSEQRSQLLTAKSRQSKSAPTEKSTSKAILEITKALARSHSASEVLTLNLTNLLILIVLKAVIFGIGLFYFGGVSFKGGYKDHGHGWGRSISPGSSSSGSSMSTSLMSESEILLMLTYLLGSSTDDYRCFHRVACENPASAKSYLKASKLMLKGAKMTQNYISYNPKYEHVLTGLDAALSHSASGGDCTLKYPCTEIPHL